ncbi:MAG: VWA domain-containing protein, partial [Rhodobacteraceae bacterium]|nr:VWA domain-containing protein [Paracoccaceae bacterium]
MTDDLDRLRAALKAAPPAPDPAAKAAVLARAMENFDTEAAAAQETASAPRPMSDRPLRAGFLTGVRIMLNRLPSRPALAATASVIALCVGLVLTQPGLLRHPAPPDRAAKPVPEQPLATARAPADKPKAAAVPPAAEVKNDTKEPKAAPRSLEEAAVPAPESTGQVAAAPPAKDMILAEPTPEEILAEPTPEEMILPPADSEAYANDTPNPVKITAEEPVSTFSIDVDTASYAVVRSSVTNGDLPPPEAVRIEEMVNYFPYSYPAPEAGDAPFRASVNLFQTPWNKDTELLRIGLQGALPALADRPPLDLVFLIDTSGSMEDANKLPLLVQSFKLMLGQLRPEDKVAIVTYAGSAGLVLEPTAARDRAKIEAALGQLMAGGATAGAEGLELAYQTAERMKGKGRVQRIILATDGDFNVGVSDTEGLEAYVARKRESGSYLSVLGFGRGNLDDATMQALAQNGNGQAAYIDSLSEAQKVLVDQLSGALFPIADDVKIQIEFNPAAVAEYRLIGYETRLLNREDFNNDQVDAGEVGSGTSVTALYEITPAGGKPSVDPLRYTSARPESAPANAGEYAFLKIRYKLPGDSTSRLI